MRIGEVAERAGVSPRALRYYEEQGLLSAQRSPGGQRTYPVSAIERVRLIQTFFAAGLASRTVLQLLPCVDSGTGSPEALELLAEERRRISETVADLHAARDALDELIVNASHPTPEHCPGLREPAWSAHVAADGQDGGVTGPRPARQVTASRTGSPRSAGPPPARCP